MKIRPLNDKVAVKYVKEEKEEKTEGGIVLPDTAKEDEKKPQQGEIIALGNQVGAEVDVDLDIGDIVVFDKYAGSKVNVDDEEYVILSVEDVLAVIE
ncbi:MAG: co-chaperone GroES [Halanaerobiaceae bacterium]